MELSVQPCVVCYTATHIDAKQRSCAKTYLHSIRVLYTSHMRELCRLFDIVCKARKANRASGVGSERTHIVVKTDWCYIQVALVGSSTSQSFRMWIEDAATRSRRCRPVRFAAWCLPQT